MYVENKERGMAPGLKEASVHSCLPGAIPSNQAHSDSCGHESWKGSQRPPSPSSSFYKWGIQGPEMAAGLTKDHSLVGSKTGAGSHNPWPTGHQTWHLSKYSLLQCFYSCTLKMRSSCKVRAKSLSNLLREEEENNGLYNCQNHTPNSIYTMED